MTERSGSPTSAVAPRSEIPTETADDDVPDAQDPEDDSPEQGEELEEGTQEMDQEEKHPTEEEMQSEYGAPDPPDILDDMEAKPASNLESDTSVLLQLVRGFRSEMLRVESTLRATMFRAVRYLVRILLVSAGIIDVTTSYLAPGRPQLNPVHPQLQHRRCAQAKMQT